MDTPSIISSPESADGPTPSTSPVGRQTAPWRPGAVRASPSATPERVSAPPTNATFGRYSSNLSPNADFQLCLANRLQARLDVTGSPEYALTWKDWDMSRGGQICALRASAHRTSDSASSGSPLVTSGWTSPIASEARQGFQDRSRGKKGTQESLTTQVVKFLPPGGVRIVVLCGWSTPSSRDWKDTAGMSTTGINPDGSLRSRLDQLPRQVQLTRGAIANSSPASTEKRGGLNPEFSRWLMGFPVEWGSCGATAMQSSRKSPRSLSKHTPKCC